MPSADHTILGKTENALHLLKLRILADKDKPSAIDGIILAREEGSVKNSECWVASEYW